MAGGAGFHVFTEYCDGGSGVTLMKPTALEGLQEKFTYHGGDKTGEPKIQAEEADVVTGSEHISYQLAKTPHYAIESGGVEEVSEAADELEEGGTTEAICPTERRQAKPRARPLGGPYVDRAGSPTARALLRAVHGLVYDEDAIEMTEAPIASANYSITVDDSQPADGPTKISPIVDELVTEQLLSVGTMSGSRTRAGLGSALLRGRQWLSCLVVSGIVISSSKLDPADGLLALYDHTRRDPLTKEILLQPSPNSIHLYMLFVPATRPPNQRTDARGHRGQAALLRRAPGGYP
ncbi:hypothetical protein DL764_003214 [Monosporascus ibericus]|uniref:Uncharacterized protein n=1 Tax=Monosporascus ibericus TaxID=155417 RepID=A0A4Q4TKP7_9PEZI|nr:hypothetical protein DL764_003214 [Monosporascus ibericus]